MSEEKKSESNGNDTAATIAGLLIFLQLTLLLIKGAYPASIDWFWVASPTWAVVFAFVAGVIGVKIYKWFESMERKPEPFEEIKGESTIPFQEKRTG